MAFRGKGVMVKIGQAAGRPLIWEAGQFLMSFTYFVVLGKRHFIVGLTPHLIWCYHLEDTAARKQGKFTILSEKFNLCYTVKFCLDCDEMRASPRGYSCPEAR